METYYKMLQLLLLHIHYIAKSIGAPNDWSAESQVLILAKHLWCDFKCRPWAKNSLPITSDLL